MQMRNAEFKTQNANACAVILAGGLGTRIRDLYPNLPKPMVPAAGAPFIEWVVRYLAAQGVRRSVISLGHLAHVAEAYFVKRPADDCQITTLREPAPLGTGGAVLFTARLAADGDPLVVTNGDSLLLADLSPVWRHWADESVDAVVLGLETDDASRYGRLEIDRDGRLLRFSEKQPGAGLINAGTYVFRRHVIDRFPRRTPLSMEHDVFPLLLAEGRRIMVCRCRAPFLDIGTPESVALADAFIRQHFSTRVAA